MLFYWYDPQYLNAQYDLVQVQAAARASRAARTTRRSGGDPKKYACAYPSYRLDKVISGKFAKSGSPAVSVIKKFKWTSADQNTVANLISGKKMKPDKAAEHVGQGEPRQGQRLAREVDVRVAAVRCSRAATDLFRDPTRQPSPV